MKQMWQIFWVISSILLVACLTTAFYIYEPRSANVPGNFKETIQIFLLCLGGAGVILSTYFTAINAIHQRESDLVQRDLDLIENTYCLIKAWDDPHMFEARKFTRRIKDKAHTTSDADLVKEINENEDIRHSILLLLNYFEQVRFSLRNKRVNDEFLKESFGSTITQMIDRFSPFTKTQGSKMVDDLNELKDLLK